ncbi:MAG TPA: SAM-dependent methyltransferase [Burkholderiales bacterium]|nr:SAM-dependent methyltransferase [Burkholderiales bacterium]
MAPSHPPVLPSPAPAAQALSAELERHIQATIEASGGWISFARYMELALYAPGLGYYSAGSVKLGDSGDFVTAPELTPLFAHTLARQMRELIEGGLTEIVEVGAGSGALAADLLLALAAIGRLPERYFILEVSADLRERQRERIAQTAPDLVDRVQWLDVLPGRMQSTLIANEVLDAIPTHVVRRHGDAIEELGVTLSAHDAPFQRSYKAATGELLAAATVLDLPDGYETELNLAARAFVKSFAAKMERGALIFIDYGFPAAEYYHPQRSRGTLMCHYRHRAHDDPFVFVGLQDITAHVDFSAIADAGYRMGLRVLGFTSQAQFLVNCGITEILSETQPADVRAYAPLAGQAQKLLSPAEMGELFKVLALGRGIEQSLLGFSSGDRTHTL